MIGFGKHGDLLSITGFWVQSIIQHSKLYKTQRLGKWICSSLQVSGVGVGGGETPTLLRPLERVNLNHWTTHVILTTLI
jgi:hypothetical protein